MPVILERPIENVSDEEIRRRMTVGQELCHLVQLWLFRFSRATSPEPVYDVLD